MAEEKSIDDLKEEYRRAQNALISKKRKRGTGAVLAILAAIVIPIWLQVAYDFGLFLIAVIPVVLVLATAAAIVLAIWYRACFTAERERWESVKKGINDEYLKAKKEVDADRRNPKAVPKGEKTPSQRFRDAEAKRSAICVLHLHE